MGGLGGAFLGDYLYGTICGAPKTPPNILPGPKPQPPKPKAPQQAPPPQNPNPKSGPGGGGESGPNTNAQFVNPAPVTCTYTWYDYYSDGKYIGSGSVSVECE